MYIIHTYKREEMSQKRPIEMKVVKYGIIVLNSGNEINKISFGTLHC